MPSESLKSKLDGNQLDLSLSSLTTVPVKELSALPKATRLDLSCNLLTIIEPDFCMLVHLVELDLSKNQLSRLPDNFGDLQKLQRLDLYHNKLTYLPLTFCRLNALKWLDLRDNPLEDSSLVAAAGDCLSDAKCRNCAKEVVTYMKKVQSDHERERQKKLNEQRALEASRKAEIEREQQRQRAEKKAEKERRRLELLKKNSEKVNEVQENNDEVSANHSKMKSHHGLDAKPERNGLSCCQFILTLLLLAIAAVCGLYVYCSGATSQSVDDFCAVAMHWLNEVIFRIQNIYDQLITRQQVQDG